MKADISTSEKTGHLYLGRHLHLQCFLPDGFPGVTFDIARDGRRYLRPFFGNRSRGVDHPDTRAAIAALMARVVRRRPSGNIVTSRAVAGTASLHKYFDHFALAARRAHVTG